MMFKTQEPRRRKARKAAEAVRADYKEIKESDQFREKKGTKTRTTARGGIDKRPFLSGRRPA